MYQHTNYIHTDNHTRSSSLFTDRLRLRSGKLTFEEICNKSAVWLMAKLFQVVHNIVNLFVVRNVVHNIGKL